MACGLLGGVEDRIAGGSATEMLSVVLSLKKAAFSLVDRLQMSP
jgi:hypothetical protein